MDSKSRANSVEINSLHRNSASDIEVMSEKYKIIAAPGSLYGNKKIRAEDYRGTSRISREVYLKETSSAQRQALLEALNRTIVWYLDNDSPIYLEGLGILTPETKKSAANYNVGAYGILRDETVKTAYFEKCDDISTLPEARYPGLADTGRLAERCQLYLPPELCISWQLHDTRRYIRGFFKDLSHEIIVKGFSDLLDSVGIFFSLHNRQGNTFRDWFAGADIGLRSSYVNRLNVGTPSFFERPVLENAHEIMEAAFGKALHTFKLDLTRALDSLGYETAELQSNIGKDQAFVKVSVFLARGKSNSGRDTLIYCTDGLRKLALLAFNNSDVVGTELTFQLEVTGGVKNQSNPFVPKWPARPLAMAWILLQSSQKKSLQVGAGLSCDTPLRTGMQTALNTIFITPFQQMPDELLSKEGAFYFRNVIGITNDESKLASKSSPDLLNMLLKHRRSDQVTRTNRTSITRQSELTSTNFAKKSGSAYSAAVANA